MKTIHSIVLMLSLLGLRPEIARTEEQVSYPEGYRTWYHVKSMVILPGHPLADPFGGIHHIYANYKGIQGYKSGNFKDGAVLVFDLLNHQETDRAIVEKERKLIGVMQRDSEKFAATGGWGFEGFAGDSKTARLVKDGGKSCFECHLSQKDKQYVFSSLRD